MRMSNGLGCVLGLVWAATGCSGEGVGTDDLSNLDEGELASTSQAVTGLVATTNCLASEQALAISAENMGRVIAVSGAFTQCIASATNVGLQLSSFGHTAMRGPYKPMAADPFANLSWVERFSKILYANRHATNISLRCDIAQPGAIAEALVGSYANDRESKESMTAGDGWRALVGISNGRSTSVADFYQTAYARAANAIWHEALHQWGYSHSDAALNASAPWIAGACMESVALASQSCGDVCSAGQRPVRSIIGGNACTCVDDPQFDVGVIEGTAGSCTNAIGLADSELKIVQDNEDDQNVNSKSGWVGAFTSNVSTTVMRFCRVPGRLFPVPRSTNYAVLRMGASCPSGSVPFSRSFDDEDDANGNSSVGHIVPSSSTTNTRLEFCMFRNTPGGNDSFPDLGMQYGVFAGALLPSLATGTIFTDDEDTGNVNRMGGSFAGSESFLVAGPNTTLRFARVR